MPNAREITKALSETFLRKGQYDLVPSASWHGDGPFPAATSSEFYQIEEGFSGLSVHSVGFEEGREDEAKVHIYVTKGSRKALKDVPETLGGVPIQINRMGKMVVRPEAASGATNAGNVYQRNDRIACGSSCAPSGESYSGTFGAIVQKGSGGGLYCLSNNHVLAACNHVPVGMPVLSPSNRDGRPGVRAPSEIARHSEIEELRSGEPQLVVPCTMDVAIAQIPNSDSVTSWQGDSTFGYDTPTAVAQLQAGKSVRKFGRTTGLTTGTLEALVPTPTPIPYKCRYFSATVWFTNVWTVVSDTDGPFALPGDSGSLVVFEDASEAAGLLFAASPNGEYGWIIPISGMLGAFGGIVLVGGHGV